MSRAQAKIFWNNLTKEQKVEFSKMLQKLNNKELALTYIGVDDEEKIQHIVLEPKDKPSQSTAPFAKSFHLPPED